MILGGVMPSLSEGTPVANIRESPLDVGAMLGGSPTSSCGWFKGCLELMGVCLCGHG